MREGLSDRSANDHTRQRSAVVPGRPHPFATNSKSTIEIFVLVSILPVCADRARESGGASGPQQWQQLARSRRRSAKLAEAAGHGNERGFRAGCGAHHARGGENPVDRAEGTMSNRPRLIVNADDL